MNNSKYTHQCRYCAYCVFTIENTYWCDELNIYITAPKRPNKCDSFLFNAIPADNPFGKPYTPRKKCDETQLRLFDMPTDRQRNKTEGEQEMRESRTSKTDHRTIIRCGNEDDAKLAYMAMFRYSFGRMTYMPSTVIDIIKANADTLTMPTLELLDRDLTDEANRYDRLYKREPTSNYGQECDRQLWLAFHAWVKKQIENKKESRK